MKTIENNRQRKTAWEAKPTKKNRRGKLSKIYLEKHDRKHNKWPETQSNGKTSQFTKSLRHLHFDA